jgi:DNA-binding GntR family transcriptional regulator
MTTTFMLRAILTLRRRRVKISTDHTPRVYELTEMHSSNGSDDLAGSVHQALRDAIVAGQLEAGEHINQDRVARELGVSRTPVREALRWLERDGLVRLEPNRGAFVSAFTDRDLFEIYELRELLEPHAAGIACAVATRAELAVLRDLADRIEETWEAEPQESFAFNRAFHERLCQPCQNGLLLSLLAQVWSQQAALRIFTRYAQGGRAFAERTHAEHHSIVEAYAARDTAAVRDLVRAHIAAAHEATVRLLAAADRPEEVA